ncbi:MAG: hypothetical protein HFE39_01470 [Clostridiales bacterium]|nr:hypothetical protein [Clostridiales bacterium]
MRRKNRSGNPCGLIFGAVFVAILLIIGLVTSQTAGRNAQPDHSQVYAELK